MVSMIAHMGFCAPARPIAALGRTHAEPDGRAKDHEKADRIERASARARHASEAAAFDQAAMAALIAAQERLSGADGHAGRAAEALSHVIDRLKDRHRPKPPPAQPEPELPPPAIPSPVVQNDPAPAQFLERVREQIRDQPTSQYPDTPFSKRGEPAPQPIPAQGPYTVFQTPGVFTPAQASAMRTVAQGQAGLAILQAGQLARYGAARPAGGAFELNHLV